MLADSSSLELAAKRSERSAPHAEFGPLAGLGNQAESKGIAPATVAVGMNERRFKTFSRGSVSWFLTFSS
ncbi:MAG: hypothetical protein R3C17_01300 [Planctomycetaceae bacterium]